MLVFKVALGGPGPGGSMKAEELVERRFYFTKGGNLLRFHGEWWRHAGGPGLKFGEPSVVYGDGSTSIAAEDVIREVRKEDLAALQVRAMYLRSRNLGEAAKEIDIVIDEMEKQ